MTRHRPLPAPERRALRLAAWGGGAAGQGYCDALDVLPPDPPIDREAAVSYHAGYTLGLEWRRKQETNDVLRILA